MTALIESSKIRPSDDWLRLISLEELLKKLAVGKLITAMSSLSFMSTLMNQIEHQEGDDDDLTSAITDNFLGIRQSILDALAGLAPLLTELPLSPAIRRHYGRLFKFVTDADIQSAPQSAVLVRDFMVGLFSELETHTYLAIDPSRLELFRQPLEENLFGLVVGDAFPDASYDIACAGRCLALEEWTAAVFHLMRVAELALRRLAGRLKIANAEFEDWDKLIRKRFPDALEEIKQSPRTAGRDRKLQYYAEALAQLGVFKDAWRNHVMHSRVKYDEGEAMAIYAAVKSFMGQLAKSAPR